LAAATLLTVGVVLGLSWLSGPTQPNPNFAKKIGMKFVRIEPGSFLMGSPVGKKADGTPDEEGRDDNETPRHVTLTRGCHMAATLVTQQQWESVLGPARNHSRFTGDKSKLPVDNVSWFDCVEFCNELSKKEGKKQRYEISNVVRDGDRITAADVKVLADGTGYGLPTEAEWEYACRAGTTTPFWFGETITDQDANYDASLTYGKDGKKGKCRGRTTGVQDFKANPWGLHDMHGNLWQWCEDWYSPYPFKDFTDPVNLAKDGADPRVLRGGSWSSIPQNCRAACRGRLGPADRDSDVGCRVVCRQD
jgi:formylglycine-generating enzyme required for sulfatase activity